MCLIVIDRIRSSIVDRFPPIRHITSPVQEDLRSAYNNKASLNLSQFENITITRDADLLNKNKGLLLNYPEIKR